MTSTAKKFLRNTAGNAIIELCLLLPLLFALLIGAVEFGRFAYASIEVSNAAHAGAQYGAQSHATASDNAGMIQAAKNDAADIEGLTVTTSAASGASLCVCSNNQQKTPSACSSIIISCSARTLECVQVTTSATIHAMFNAPYIPKTQQVVGQATMMVEK